MYMPTFAQALVPLLASCALAAPTAFPDADVGINDATFQQAVLNAHNTARAKHGVPALTWDNTLAQTAQSWANHDCDFNHSVSFSSLHDSVSGHC
jgi:pathogenesis-related protein 1